MSSLTFHKCHLCHGLFYHSGRVSYCPKCIPPKTRCTAQVITRIINSRYSIEEKRAKWRENWRRRMQSPEFREKERIRSLARSRAEKKYAKEAV